MVFNRGDFWIFASMSSMPFLRLYFGFNIDYYNIFTEHVYLTNWGVMVGAGRSK